MFTQESINEIRKVVRDITGQALPAQVNVQQGNGLQVCLKDGRASIIAENRNALARGFFLLARAAREGKQELSTRQERRFSSCGVMLDVSRNMVMKVEHFKKWLRWKSPSAFKTAIA